MYSSRVMTASKHDTAASYLQNPAARRSDHTHTHCLETWKYEAFNIGKPGSNYIKDKSHLGKLQIGLEQSVEFQVNTQNFLVLIK